MYNEEVLDFASKLRSTSKNLDRLADKINFSSRNHGGRIFKKFNRVNDTPAFRSLLGFVASNIHKSRANRNAIFRFQFSSEPAWDMLLSAYVSFAKDETLTITSLCAASNATQTTALRHLAMLEDADLVETSPSSDDRRVRFARISQRGMRLVDIHIQDYLDLAESYFNIEGHLYADSGDKS